MGMGMGMGTGTGMGNGNELLAIFKNIYVSNLIRKRDGDVYVAIKKSTMEE
jgi:hypothetical protein